MSLESHLTSQVVLPGSALNLYVSKVKNFTFTPGLDHILELELKSIFNQHNLLSEFEYLADINLISFVSAASHNSGGLTSLNATYYQHSFIVQAEYQIEDLRVNNKLVSKQVAQAEFKYNSRLERLEQREIVDGYNQAVKLLAKKIIMQINQKF